MPSFSDLSLFFTSQVLGSITLPKKDLSGKTYIVTGANTGLGLDAVKHLSAMGAGKVILACRSVSKGEAAVRQIDNTLKTEFQVWPIDLDSYASVLAFGERARSLPRLDGFIANAGIELSDYRTSEGLEMTLNVNVVSTILSAIAVLPVLRSTAKAYGQANLSIVGTLIHTLAPDDQLDIPSNIDIFTALSDPATAKLADQARYTLSKVIMHLAAHTLAKKAGPGVVVNVVNPGWCGTELMRNSPLNASMRFMFGRIGRTSEEGSRILVQGMVSGPETNGKYVSENVVKRESTFVRSDRGKEMEARVWKELMVRYRKISPEVASYVE